MARFVNMKFRMVFKTRAKIGMAILKIVNRFFPLEFEVKD